MRARWDGDWPAVCSVWAVRNKIVAIPHEPLLVGKTAHVDPYDPAIVPIVTAITGLWFDENVPFRLASVFVDPAETH